LTDPRPNILHIIPHDLGQELGCYGRRPVTSPHLDELAAEGVRLDGYVCASTPCSPSRGCLMTGMYAHRNGLVGLVNRGWSLPREVRSVVDHLNEAGYETVLAGLQHERRQREELRYGRDLSRRDDGSEDGGDILIERGVVFLNLGSWETHAPWSRPEYTAHRPKLEDVAVPPFLPDCELTRRQLAEFLAAIGWLDQQVGLLLDTLRETGLEEDTLVALTTDHGIAFPRAKGTLYEPGVQTAGILRWPGRIPAGRTCTQRIPNIDLLPTLLEAAGREPPPGLDGRSFWRLASGEDGYVARRAVFAERNFHDDFDPQRSVVQGRWKYIRNFAERRVRSHPRDMDWMHEAPEVWDRFLETPRPCEQLFDLEQDPDEVRNLADAPAHAATLRELRGLLLDWMEETGDFLRGAKDTVLWPEEERDTERLRTRDA
jgi:arylsulfatase A-like enzyme